MMSRKPRTQRWQSLKGMTEAQRRDHVRILSRERYARAAKVRRENRPADVLKSISAMDLAYMAGLVDGEGSIYCLAHAGGKTCYPAITVAMTDFGVIEWLAARWQVQVSRMPRRNPKHKPQIFVRLSGERARLLCELLLPYLKVKRAQAALVQEFPLEARVGPGVKIDLSEINRRRFVLRDRINGLNHAPRNATYRRGAMA